MLLIIVHPFFLPFYPHCFPDGQNKQGFWLVRSRFLLPTAVSLYSPQSHEHLGAGQELRGS